MEEMRAAVAAGPSIVATPGDINAAYRRNPIAADDRYKRRVVRLQAVVGEIVEDRDGVPFVALRSGHGDSDSDGVACTWDGRHEVARLHRGDEIVAKGFGGGQFAGTPVFMMCKLESLEWPKRPAPAAPVDPGMDAWEWNSKLNPQLKKAGVSYKLNWVGNGELWIESKQCDKAKAAIDAIGKTPHGYTVLCTQPNDLPSKALWRESNL